MGACDGHAEGQTAEREGSCAEMVTTSEGPPTEPWSQSVEHPSEAISVRQGQALRGAQSVHL